jgi:hypothetical protein
MYAWLQRTYDSTVLRIETKRARDPANSFTLFNVLSSCAAVA